MERGTRLVWLPGVVTAAAIGMLVVSLWGVGGAEAANANVNVGQGGAQFNPESVNIDVNDTVTFNHFAGGHNVTFVSGISFDVPITMGDPSAQTPMFGAAGTFYYYCEVHANANQANAQGLSSGAMVGRVIVGDGGPPPTNTVMPTQATTTATSTTAPPTQATSTATATNTGAPTATVPATPARGPFKGYAPNTARD